MTSNSTSSATRRKILVAGATGKQGRALIQALLNPISSHSKSSPAETQNGNATGSQTTSSSDPNIKDEIIWDILALTRNAATPRAKSLLDLPPEASPHTINLVEGDVGDETSIRSIFEHENESPAHNGIWGVFAVLMFAGLGVKNEHLEVKQGKNLAGLAFEFNIQAFIYSSALPPGRAVGEPLDPTYQDKFDIEEYCQELGPRDSDRGGGLNWIIVRPGFFMENFDGFIGSITLTVFREGLTEDAAVPLIAAKDIGRVVAAIFKNPKQFIHKFVALSSGAVTMREIESSYHRATGNPMTTIPALMARLIIRMNAGSQTVINITQRGCDARKKGEYYAEFEAEVDLAQSVCYLQNYEEWKKSELELTAINRAEVESGWNQISLWKLLTGQS